MSTSSTSDNPTLDFYGHLDDAFVFFNDRLFDGALPKIMFELTNKKQVAGLFKAASWQATDGVFVHSIAINPQIIVQSTPLVIYITLVKEMVHLWQNNHGTPSRPGYHNGEWAEKLESIGLMPSSTGLPDGKKVGQKMSCYLIGGGDFELAAVDFFLQGNFMNLVDATIDDADVLKLRNQLLLDCVNKNQSLTEYYAGWQSKAIEFDAARQPSEVFKIDTRGYEDDFDNSLEYNDDDTTAEQTKPLEGLGITPPRKKQKKQDDVPQPTSYDSSDRNSSESRQAETPSYNSSEKVEKVELRGIVNSPSITIDDDYDEPNYNSEQVSVFNLSEVEGVDLAEQTEWADGAEEEHVVIDNGGDVAIHEINETIKPPEIEAKTAFEKVLSHLVLEPLQDTTDILGVPDKPKYDFSKTKYQCPSCSNNVWGKPSMNILCIDCNSTFDVAK